MTVSSEALTEAGRGVEDHSSERWSRAARGRTNTRDDIRAKAEELLETADFNNLRDRTQQARELRVQLLGKDARRQDQRPGYSTDFIKRIIGEVDRKRRGPA